MSRGNTLRSMQRKLKGIGLYRLDGHSLVDAELKAYAAGLDWMAGFLWELEQECFVQTASGYGLDTWERMSGGARDSLPLSERRRMLLSRCGVMVNDNTEQGLQKALLAVGIRAGVSGTPQRNAVYINIIDTFGNCAEKSQADVMRAAQEFLPAHLEWQFDFGTLSWSFIGKKDLTFSQMDAADWAWRQIDAYSVEA